MCDNFRDACFEMIFIEDDNEYVTSIEESHPVLGEYVEPWIDLVEVNEPLITEVVLRDAP